MEKEEEEKGEKVKAELKKLNAKDNAEDGNARQSPMRDNSNKQEIPVNASSKATENNSTEKPSPRSTTHSNINSPPPSTDQVSLLDLLVDRFHRKDQHVVNVHDDFVYFDEPLQDADEGQVYVDEDFEDKSGIQIPTEYLEQLIRKSRDGGSGGGRGGGGTVDLGSHGYGAGWSLAYGDAVKGIKNDAGDADDGSSAENAVHGGVKSTVRAIRRGAGAGARDLSRLGALLPEDADLHQILANGAGNYDLNLAPYKINGDTDYVQSEEEEEEEGGVEEQEGAEEEYKELCVRVDVEVFCIYKKLPNELNL